jgi:hypothetical protein
MLLAASVFVALLLWAGARSWHQRHLHAVTQAAALEAASQEAARAADDLHRMMDPAQFRLEGARLSAAMTELRSSQERLDPWTPTCADMTTS